MQPVENSFGRCQVIEGPKFEGIGTVTDWNNWVKAAKQACNDVTPFNLDGQNNRQCQWKAAGGINPVNRVRDLYQER